ncbi:MAG: inositol monophosphatase family protein [Planctomycetota bacterium]
MLDYLKVCEQAVRTGGAVLMDKIGRVEVREKGRSDLVTEADFASQELVRRTILAAFPDHVVVGEEDPQNGGSGHQPSGDPAEYRWIVDPLDGTTNYVHQVPHFCVSLALERRGQLQVSAVYNPVADECFSAVAGEGARLNGKPIRTSNVADISQALAAVGFAAVVDPDAPDLKLFLAAIPHCQAMRRTGSAALNLCYLAAGRFDLSWAYSTKSWDVAAGVLMIREAGGIVTAPCGGPLMPDDGHYLAAANAQLHAQLRAIMTRAGLE